MCDASSRNGDTRLFMFPRAQHICHYIDNRTFSEGTECTRSVLTPTHAYASRVQEDSNVPERSMENVGPNS